MNRKILAVLVAAPAVLAVVVATRPAKFHIERSAVMAAPPEVPFALVDDFHAWNQWSPYDKLDPQMKRTFDGPASGVGSTYAWQGNDKAGEGRMTIVTSEKSSHIGIKLEFTRPFSSTNAATFTFAKVPEGTKVTWAMDGENGFLAKAACMVMNMDELVGGDFDKGLASMKTIAEASARAQTVGAAH